MERKPARPSQDAQPKSTPNADQRKELRLDIERLEERIAPAVSQHYQDLNFVIGANSL